MSDHSHEFTRRDDFTPSAATRILWWFSAIIPESLNDSVSDRNRAKIIGLGVMFTWLYATIAWTYLWTTNISSPLLYIPLGIFIGFGILTIDRMLIASMSKFRRNFIAISLRVLMALFLGAFIAQPLILWLFEQDINTEISLLHDRKISDKRAELELINSSELNDLKSREEILLNELKSKEDAVALAEQEYLKEIDGTGGSGKYGIAGVAARKEIALNRVTGEYNLYRAEAIPELETIRSRINAIGSEINALIENFRDTNLTSGFLIRIEALRSLFEKDATHALRNRYYLLLAILVIFELIPVISKLFLMTGSYDEKVRLKDELETELAISNKARELKLKMEYNNLSEREDSELLTQLFKDFSSKRLERMNGSVSSWSSSEVMTFDQLWNRIKDEVLSKQEN